MLKTAVRKASFAIGGLALAMCSTFGHAQDYPTKPVKVIIAFKAGGRCFAAAHWVKLL